MLGNIRRDHDLFHRDGFHDFKGGPRVWLAAHVTIPAKLGDVGGGLDRPLNLVTVSLLFSLELVSENEPCRITRPTGLAKAAILASNANEVTSKSAGFHFVRWVGI